MKKTLLVMAMSSLLVACGSGGSGNPDSLSSKPYITASGTTLQQYISKGGKIKGSIAYNKEMSKDAKVYAIADDLSSIMLDGKKIDLIEDHNLEYLSGSKNVFAVWFEHRDEQGAVTDYINFVGGKPTQQMPESGKARYDLGEDNYLDVIFAGKSKGVKGRIGDLDFKAKLFGNVFEGTKKVPSSSHKNRQYETHLRGGFYGKDAVETAGYWVAKVIEDGKVVKDMNYGGIFYGEKE